ncbi:MAG: hypothetical protein DCC44_11345 [Acidobacteria bacterium]|nr:MAG: hypothetical protein DCC44_11345 [Acidobacteriota bacterium]
MRFQPTENALSRFPSFRIDLNAKNAKIFAKFTRRCREILLFFGLGGHSFAAFVGFASRTLRFQPTENALSRFPSFRIDLNGASLRELCGPHFANSAFPAKQSYIVSLWHFSR